MSHIDKSQSFQVLLWSLLSGQQDSPSRESGRGQCGAGVGGVLSGWFAGMKLGNAHADFITAAKDERADRRG